MTATQTPQDANEAAIGAVASTAGLGAILFDGRRFVEAKPHGNTPPNYACDGCAFLRKPRYCGSAIEYKAKAAFGGDCDERDVIYVEAPNDQAQGAVGGLIAGGSPGAAGSTPATNGERNANA